MEARKSMRNSLRKSIENERTFSLTIQDNITAYDKDMLQVELKPRNRASLKGSFSSGLQNSNSLADRLLLNQ
jgi:hypothetical protein